MTMISDASVAILLDAFWWVWIDRWRVGKFQRDKVSRIILQTLLSFINLFHFLIVAIRLPALTYIPDETTFVSFPFAIFLYLSLFFCRPNLISCIIVIFFFIFGVNNTGFFFTFAPIYTQGKHEVFECLPKMIYVAKECFCGLLKSFL